MELISQLLDLLSRSINAWASFNSSNGDIGYFFDIISLPLTAKCRARESLRAISDAFEDLKGLQQTLLLLENSCHRSAKAVRWNSLRRAYPLFSIQR